MEKEILGNISSIESMGLVDGPGIRYVVFCRAVSYVVYIVTIPRLGIRIKSAKG